MLCLRSWLALRSSRSSWKIQYQLCFTVFYSVFTVATLRWSWQADKLVVKDWDTLDTNLSWNLHAKILYRIFGPQTEACSTFVDPFLNHVRNVEFGSISHDLHANNCWEQNIRLLNLRTATKTGLAATRPPAAWLKVEFSVIRLRGVSILQLSVKLILKRWPKHLHHQ